MPDYRRNRVPGGSYFFTVNLLERNNCLLVTHIDSLRDSIRQVRVRRPFHIDAWVVLPFKHLFRELSKLGRWVSPTDVEKNGLPESTLIEITDVGWQR
jgi:hypothetical protein